MAQLTGNQIDQSYLGLIKTVDNAALDPTTAKQLTDGGGNNLPISASQAGVVYTGTQDFTGATVTGAGGAASCNCCWVCCVSPPPSRACTTPGCPAPAH